MAGDGYQRGPSVHGAYSGKWQDRFAFFDVFGAPGTPRYKEGVRALKPMARIKYGLNVWALFFGPLFFLGKGMLRKGLVLVLLLVLVVSLVPYIPMFLAQGVLTGMALATSIAANWAFYNERVRGDQSWNPWKGMGAW